MQLLSFQIISLFVLLGSLAGFLAGLLGIGGGVILVPLFLWAFVVADFSPDLIVHTAFATSLAIIVPTSISSTYGHRKRGNVAWNQVSNLAIGAAIGAALGAWLAAGLSGTSLKGMFGLMQIGVGLKLFIFHPRLPPEERGPISFLPLFLVGFFGGAFSAFFGVGGGVVAVPLMVIILRLPIHLAVGNSSALIVVSSFCGALAYTFLGWNKPGLAPFSLGYVNVLVAAIIAPLSMACARFGARVASRTQHDKLMKIFAGFLILIGVRMAIIAYT